MYSYFDLLLITVCIGVMLIGFYRRRNLWRIGVEEQRFGDWKAVTRQFIGIDRIMRRRISGLAHVVLSCGFVFFLAIIVIFQTPLSVPVWLSSVLCFLTNSVGFGMLLATSYFVFKFFSAKRTFQNSRNRLLPLILLTLVILSGFFTEGFRLSITEVGFHWKSPLGSILSAALPDSPIIMELTYRVHFYAVLSFIALLPFTSMHHIFSSSLNVYYENGHNPGILKKIILDKEPFGVKTIDEFSWKQLLDIDSCVQCRRCDAVCPATLAGMPFSPAGILENAYMLMTKIRQDDIVTNKTLFPELEEGISKDQIWFCSSCMACAEECPVYVDPLDKIIDMRRNAVLSKAEFPRELQSLYESLEIYGDVFGKGKSKRKELLPSLDVEKAVYNQKYDYILWLGCQASFHERSKGILSALLSILKASGMKIAVLGEHEVCCGDTARRTGNEYLFQQLVETNIESLSNYHFKRLLTVCPHCFNTLKNEYPQFGGSFDVHHYVDVLKDLCSSEELKLRSSSEITVTVQDACYLCRANSIRDEPREILQKIAGVSIVEMPDSTICCGAGGGRMWIHDNCKVRMNDNRAKMVRDTKSNILITLCPYCLVMMEDGMVSIKSKSIVVRDLCEFLEQHLL